MKGGNVLYKKKNKAFLPFFVVFILIPLIFIIMISQINEKYEKKFEEAHKDYFKIISSNENKDIEEFLMKFARENNIDLKIDYAGTIDIMDKLNSGEKYDAVWCSNSMWLYMLNKDIRITDSKSTSINPVVFGITKSKAKDLGFIGKEIYTKDILEAIKSKKLKFSMTSPTQTNTGATAYLGFVSTLAGNPEVLTEKHLEDEKLRKELTQLYSGVTRSSGSEEFLEEMFLSGEYEALITYESSIININKKLEEQGKDPLYILYPVDGVSISDSPFAYINNKDENKKEEFLKLQGYILSNEGQNKLMETGRRVWFGGINKDADKEIFNPSWGIDTNKYIVPIKYPSKNVVKTALGVYQTELRKPLNMVFCLDYSGSMTGEGSRQLIEAMQFILNEEEASKNLLQFSNKDKITIIPFNSEIIGKYHTENGLKTENLIRQVQETVVSGGTDIYKPVMEGLEILKKEDLETYNTAIVLMTDGASNYDRMRELQNKYRQIRKDIPVFSIMFGSASARQLNDIAKLTNAKVFDGRTNLLGAFKEVRGYN